jgi:hypothetical protein
VLVDLFERIEQFFKRLECYTEIRPTEAMTDIIVKVMVEVLSILAVATKEIKQSRKSEPTGRWTEVWPLTEIYLETYVKKLVGRNDIEDALKRLDNLTQDEARMAIAENLKVTRDVENKVKEVIDGA